MHAIRLHRAIAHDVVADFALWRLNRMIDLARRRLQNFSHLPQDRPRGNIFDRLHADQPRLPHLFHAHQVPVVSISGRPHGNFKFVLIVSSIRRGFANVPLHAAGPQHRPRHAKRDGICRCQNSDALGARDPDAVLRQQSFVFNDARFKILAESFHFLFERVIGFVLQPADAKRMRRQPRPAILFKYLQNFFSLAEAIKKRRERPNIQSMRA